MYGNSGGGAGASGMSKPFMHKGPAGVQKAPLTDLPPNLRIMFEPRMPIIYKGPIDKKRMLPYSGIAQFANNFETTPPPPVIPFETPADRKRKRREKMEKLNTERNELLLSDWDPHSNPKATDNAYHTLFVGRLSYETNEKKLKREFEQFGTIKMAKIVTDLDGKSRGYGFIEFATEADLTSAYNRAEGKKIDGRRIVIDVERGRTVRNWKPMRFGGGLGGRKPIKGKKAMAEEAAKKIAEEEAAKRANIYGPVSGGGGGDRGAGASSSSYSSRGVDRDRNGGGDRDRRERSRERNTATRDSRGGGDRDRDGRRERSRSRDRNRDRGDRDGRGDRGDRDQGGGGYRGGNSAYGPSSSSSSYGPYGPSSR